MDLGSISDIPLYYYIALVLLLLGGAYFASAETSLASVNKIRMISDADGGSKKASKVLYVLDNFDDALTALLIGNNVMHIAFSSLSTVCVTKLWGNAAVSIATFITTFIVFIFAEMIPKAYAKACSERIAPNVAPSLILIMKILVPLIAFFKVVTNLIVKLFPAAKDEDLTVTEDELSDIIESIDEEDCIDEDTTELLQSALEYTKNTAKDILVPWDRVVTVGEWMDEDEIYKIIDENHYSRLPVLDKNGNILGVIHITKFLKAKIRQRKTLKSRSMLDKPYYIPTTLPIDDILPDLSAHRTHMAFVKNGSNQVIGIITVEDILEQLVGEIYDEEEVQE